MGHIATINMKAANRRRIQNVIQKAVTPKRATAIWLIRDTDGSISQDGRQLSLQELAQLEADPMVRVRLWEIVEPNHSKT